MEKEVKCTIKENRTSQKIKSDMHGHPATLLNAIIPRTFRWTLTSDLHPDIHWWMKSIKTDYVNKKLSIEVFDDAKGNIYNWLESLINKELNKVILTHLDGCGDAISLIEFSSLEIKEHSTDYDYKSSGILTHRITINYKKSRRVNQLNVH